MGKDPVCPEQLFHLVAESVTFSEKIKRLPYNGAAFLFMLIYLNRFLMIDGIIPE